MLVLVGDVIDALDDDDQVAVEVAQLLDLPAGEVEPVVKVGPEFLLREVELAPDVEDLPDPDNDLVNNVVGGVLVGRAGDEVGDYDVLVVLARGLEVAVDPLRGEDLLALAVLRRDDERRVRRLAAVLPQPPLQPLELLLEPEDLAA